MPLSLRSAVVVPVVATVLNAALLVALRGVEEMSARPTALAFGPLLALLWWHPIVRPRHRWWALGAAALTVVPVYLLLRHLILAWLPAPWYESASMFVATCLAAATFVAVTRRDRMPFTGRTGTSRIAPGEAYEERFRFTGRDLWAAPFCAAVVVAGVFMFGDKPLVAVGCIAIGTGYLAVRVVSMLSRRVALRVDATGVTLGETPPWPAARGVIVPWADIETVVLWSKQAGSAKVPYVGVRRRAGLPPLPGMVISERVHGRTVNFWRLHRPSLEAAVRHFAPTVAVEQA